MSSKTLTLLNFVWRENILKLTYKRLDISYRFVYNSVIALLNKTNV